MYKFNENEKDELDILSAQKGVKILKKIFDKEKELKLLQCARAKNITTVVKNSTGEIQTQETASETIKANIAFIEGMQFILNYADEKWLKKHILSKNSEK